MIDEPLRCQGMRDLLPGEMTRLRRVEGVFSSICRSWGYQEVRTPTVEHLWLFTTVGTLSPQMLSRIYSFLDWDGWSGGRVVLRPDGTIPTARLYVESLSEQEVAKLFYMQNVFRFADGDDSRENWQCGAELMGDTQPQGDVELALVGLETLSRLGLGSVQLCLSHPGILREILAKANFAQPERLRLYDRILDGDMTAFSEVQERLPQVAASFAILLAEEGEGLAYLSNLRAAFAGAIPELEGPLDELAMVAGVLSQMGCDCKIAVALVRNFEYYTGPVFTYSVGNDEVGGGGRYDSLLALVGGKPKPASGFALDGSLLAQMLMDDIVPVLRIMVRPAVSEAIGMAAAFQAAAALRSEGWSAQVAGADGTNPGIWQLVVGAEGYMLQAPDSEERRLDDIKSVVAVLESVARSSLS